MAEGIARTSATLPLPFRGRAGFGAILLTLIAAGCATLAPESRANAVRGPTPEQGDRCAHAADVLAQKGCERERDKAHAYLKSLSQGEPACLDPIFNSDMTNCRARASVEDQDPTAIQLHLVDVDPNSSWAPKANQRLWYENTALIDLYLQEKGF